MQIEDFSGEFEFLSNSYPCPVQYEFMDYPSGEHTYQAAKAHNAMDRRRIQQVKTITEAMQIGRSIKLHKDWEKQKLVIMYKVVYAKFSQNEELKQKLLSTNESTIKAPGDYFWGLVGNQGKNHLGQILMQVRDDIKNGIVRYEVN